MAKREIDRRAFLATSAATTAGMLTSGTVNAAPSGSFTPRSVVPGNTIGAHPPPPFSKAEYQERLRRVRDRMAKDNIDMLFVTMPEDMCYLHGLELSWYQQNCPKSWAPSSLTAVHVDHDTLIHFDSHDELMAATSVATDIRRPRPGGERACEGHVMELEAAGWLNGTVGLQYNSYRPRPLHMKQIEAVFSDRGCELIDASEVMIDVKVHKSPAEIEVVEEAGRIADIGLQAAKDTVRPGMTELELYGEIVRAMTRAGGGMSGLLCAVKAGGNHFIHGIASERVIQEVDHVVVDVCGVKNRYHCNTCRAFFVGEPPQELVDLYAMNGRAMDVVHATGKPGLPLNELTRTLREFYKETGAWQLAQQGKIDGWLGGYELGISFPPDWCGWWTFTVGEEDRSDWVMQERQVSNYESFATGTTGLIDTFIYEKGGCRSLTTMAPELIVVS